MKKRALAAAAIAAAMLLTGCSGGAAEPDVPEGDSTESSGLEVTSVNLGIIPTSDAATAYIALNEGYFAEEGLEVKMEVMQNAAAITPGILNGQLQFGTAAIAPVVSAVATGLPLVIVANGGNTAESADEDPTAVIVRADSGIESPKDLEGKTVAVNALGAVAELVVRQVIDDDGGDATKTTFVAMPFSDTAAALERGDVDGAFIAEPFRTSSLEAGLKSIASPLYEVMLPGESQAIWFASAEFVAEAPNTVAAFNRALQRAAEAANEDQDLARTALQEFTNMPPDVAARINLCGFGPEVSTAAVDHYISVMEAQGFIEKGAVTSADVLLQ